MSNDDLLEKVKIGLSADDNNDNDGTLTIKIVAIKQYMLNSGVSEEQIETDLGIATLTIGVNDIWDLAPGDLKFSTLFIDFVTQLAVKSLPITE
jgi:hypothetical protein